MNFSEQRFSFESDPNYPLSAILALPDSPLRVPAVVFVQGAGPQDKDASVAMNKPLRDIARGLAEAGIASIRFDKRTLTHADKCKAVVADLTVKEEITDDAAAAAFAVRELPGVDKKRIYLLGHGLGGMLAPRIAFENPGLFAGIVILSGSPRSLREVLHDQYIKELEDMPDNVRETMQKQIESLFEMIEAFASMPDDDVKNIDVGGVSGYYMKEIDTHTAHYYIGKLTNTPILILHGQEDTEVPYNSNFTCFSDIAAGKENIRLKSFEGLNHYFMKSITGTIEDYAEEGTVSDDVISDIARFIL